MNALLWLVVKKSMKKIQPEKYSQRVINYYIVYFV